MPFKIDVSISSAMAAELLEYVDDITHEVKKKIEGIESSLRQKNNMYLMHQMECIRCGRRHPQNAKRCHPCNNDDLRQRYCADETRIADFCSILREAWLFGVEERFDSLSVASIIERLSLTSKTLKHSCDAEDNCPLKVELRNLLKDISHLRDNASGMQLEHFERGT
jgi:predicted Zn-ribbon and HTH transcriptional regulator